MVRPPTYHYTRYSSIRVSLNIVWQNPILCLNFFRWLAKDNFKKEYPGFPPLEVPLAYPFIDYTYGDTPMGDELERTWSVNQLIRAFEERLETHDHLVPMARDRDLDTLCPVAYSPPSLDDQLLDEFYDDMYN